MAKKKSDSTNKGQVRDQGNIASFLVYDRKSGDVLHVHHIAILPGMTMPPESELEQFLAQHGAQKTSRSASQIGAVRCKKKDLSNPSRYRVDPKTRRITAMKVPKSKQLTLTRL